ncbi:unnamed protein product [Pneumocystis jirovecii]|uniref:Uncharacterized protein n=1 Tax=Pneumocystis jirovecii TaxID=42068 RepID=L0PGJ2_PNEJI|nr:unnamed protein product [Pneumocystis jirovecii]
MFEPFLKLEDVVLKTIESLKNFFITRIINQITIKSYNSLENSVENFSNKNIDDFLKKVKIIKDQVNTLEYISKELNKYSKELEFKCEQLLK